VGISPLFLPYVFDRFAQQDINSHRNHGGMGIGLSIVKQLVELHGGTVSAFSGGEDRGSTFTVSLPMTAVAPLALQPAHAVERASAREKTYAVSRGTR